MKKNNNERIDKKSISADFNSAAFLKGLTIPLLVAGVAVIVIQGWLIMGRDSNSSNNQDQGNDEFQTVRVEVNARGYKPGTLYARKGIPVKWIVDVTEPSGCLSSIAMPEYGINSRLQPGENVFRFTPSRTGIIEFSCGMQMVWGKFVIVE